MPKDFKLRNRDITFWGELAEVNNRISELPDIRAIYDGVPGNIWHVQIQDNFLFWSISELISKSKEDFFLGVGDFSCRSIDAVPKVAAKISAPFTVETEISKLHHPLRAGGHEIVSIKTIAQRVTDGDRILVTSNEEKKENILGTA